MNNKSYLSVMSWITVPIAIGFMIGSLTKPQVSTWYSALNHSPLTPPHYVFPVAWTILYAIIGIAGWLMWSTARFAHLRFIKNLYVIQLILNWSWTPLFFHYHVPGFSLLVLLVMDGMVGTIIWLAYRKIRSASLLMTIYLLWILFATHLNFYIWRYN